MNQIMEIYSEIAQNCPELDSGDLKNIIIGSIEEQIPKKLAEVEISSSQVRYRMVKSQKFNNRLKMGERRNQLKKENDKIDFINSVLTAKSALETEEISSVFEPVLPEEPIHRTYEDFQHPHMFPNQNKLYIKSSSYNQELKPDLNISKFEQKSSNLYDAVKIAQNLSNKRINSHELIYDKVYDKILNIDVDLGAKDTLNLWLNLIDEIEPKYSKMINLKWKGELDISEEDFVDFAVKIMIKSGSGPKALDNFNAIEAVEEGRR